MNISLTRFAAAGLMAAGVSLTATPAHAAIRICTFPGSPSSTIDRAVAREVFKTAGIDASFLTDVIAGSDDDGVSLVEVRRTLMSKCDVIAGFPRSSVADARSRDLAFSHGYLQAGYVSVEAARDAAHAAPAHADGARPIVAATYGSPAQLIAVQSHGVKLDLENTPALTVAAVADGRAGRAIVWYPSFVAYRQAHPRQRFTVSAAASPYADWHLVFAFPTRHASLSAKIDRALATMQRDGRLASLTRGWALPAKLEKTAATLVPPPSAYRNGAAHVGHGAGVADAATAGRHAIVPAVFGGARQGGFLKVSAEMPSQVPSFDAVQVAHGKRLFANACAKCHGAHLEGVTAPALRGPAFAPASNSHLTIGGIFGYMSTNMPADRPGKLRPQDYADIMAFLLSSNGYQPKAAKLTAEVAGASATPLNAGPRQ